MIFILGALLLMTGVQEGSLEPFPPFPPSTYICRRAGSPIRVDGKLNEEAWEKAVWTGPFVDIEGPQKPRPRCRTRAKMLWNDSSFYIAAELKDPHLWATLTERDSVIYHDNDFEVFIDPDGDTHQYYEIEINALGTVWDLFLDKPYRDGCRPLFFWDIAGLQTGIQLQGTLNDPSDQDEGWTVELGIPWAALAECAPENRPPRPGEQWRVNFSRVQWRLQVQDGSYAKILDQDTDKPLPEDNWVWSPQGAIAMHQPETWGFVQFSGMAAGAGEESFLPRREEEAKWALRRVYFRQQAFRKEKGRYARDPSELDLPPLEVPGYIWPPALYAGPSFFEAVLPAREGPKHWRIREDGRVWCDS